MPNRQFFVGERLIFFSKVIVPAVANCAMHDLNCSCYLGIADCMCNRNTKKAVAAFFQDVQQYEASVTALSPSVNKLFNLPGKISYMPSAVNKFSGTKNRPRSCSRIPRWSYSVAFWKSPKMSHFSTTFWPEI